MDIPYSEIIYGIFFGINIESLTFSKSLLSLMKLWNNKIMKL